jgi:aspartate/methionine/tyrosine aminotransferase
VQAALPDLLAFGGTVSDAIRHRTQANLALLREAAASAPHLNVLPVEGGWSAVLRLPSILTDTQWTEGLIQEEGVLVQPGYLYDFEEEAMLVLSLLTNSEVFEEGVERLCAHVETVVRRVAP